MLEMFAPVPPLEGLQTVITTTAATNGVPHSMRNMTREGPLLFPITFAPTPQAMTSQATFTGIVYLFTSSIQALA